ncbi:MAG: type II toxin-antitoxin system prevent-host-death family antitoxin [Acidobacteriota bacterium]
MEVNIHQAKTHLSRLIEQALSGEEITIAKAGKPMVRLVPIEVKKPVLGSARGTFTLKEGWDDPLTDSEFDELFGGEIFPK